MEKRPFKFGESSIAIILPKVWASKNNLNKDSPIYLEENDNGILYCQEQKSRKKRLKRQ